MSATTTTDDTTYLPLHPPPTTYKDDPRATLSDSEQKMYNEILAYFTKSEPEYALPNEKAGKLTDDEKFWLSRECLLRCVQVLVRGRMTRLTICLKVPTRFQMESPNSYPEARGYTDMAARVRHLRCGQRRPC